MAGESVGDMIARGRLDVSMSQVEVAKAVGVASNTLSKWETGASRPQLFRLKKLCEVLKLDENTVYAVWRKK